MSIAFVESVTRLSNRRRLVLTTSIVAWLLAVGAGLIILCRYENTPGATGTSPAQWPAESRIQPTAGQATLVIVVHPHCPCTRASIGELALVMARCRSRVTAYVLFVKPEGVAENWEKTDLWVSAAGIPGVNVICDEKGDEAGHFNSRTSGETMLYDQAGRLVFAGGITASRGHSGDNAGRSAIVSLLTEGATPKSNTFVFGCSLRDAASESLEGAKQCKR
jgi:hypothetical protein